MKKVYDFLRKCFPEKTPELKRGVTVSSYLLISQLMEDYNLKGKEEAINNFIIDFDHRRRTLKKDNDFVTYDKHLARSSDSEEAIAYRHHMLLREFHTFVPDLIPNDSQRGFDEAQRIAIYRRDGGDCKYCGKEVPWNNFHADHIVAHSQAGPTTVDNGWLACSKCNTKKSNKSVDSLV